MNVSLVNKKGEFVKTLSGNFRMSLLEFVEREKWFRIKGVVSEGN